MDSAAQLRALEREVASLKSEMNNLDPTGGAVSRASVNAALRPKGGVSLPTTPPLNSSSKPSAAKLIEAEKPMVSLLAGDLIWLRSEGLSSGIFGFDDATR
jgi:hypothetical protein